MLWKAEALTKLGLIGGIPITLFSSPWELCAAVFFLELCVHLRVTKANNTAVLLENSGTNYSFRACGRWRVCSRAPTAVPHLSLTVYVHGEVGRNECFVLKTVMYSLIWTEIVRADRLGKMGGIFSGHS